MSDDMKTTHTPGLGRWLSFFRFSMESLRELFLGHNLNPFDDSFQEAENSVITKKKKKITNPMPALGKGSRGF